MIGLRGILNAKQTQVHPGDPAKGGSGKHSLTSTVRRESELRESGALFTQGIEKRPWGNREFRVKDDFGNEIKFTEPA
jgi:uncharacterized glyoxalase superfamily protein PhnB